MAFKSKVVADLATTATQVTETVTAGQTQTIIGFSLANTGSTNLTISAKLVKNSGDEAFLVKDATVLAGGAIAIIGGDQKHVLETGDEIQAYASIVNSVDSVVSYLV